MTEIPMNEKPPTGSATGTLTVVEDLMLLLFQPDSGTIAGETTLYYVLAGGVLTEFALDERVRLDGAKVVADGEPPTDALLAPAWGYAAEKPRNVQTVLAAIGPALRAPVLERLVERGELRRTRGKLGLTRLELGDTGRREALMADVRSALVDGITPAPRTAALAALLSGSGTLPQFHREIPWTSPVIARAKELERGDWGAGAAAEAVTRTMTAIVVNNVIVAMTVLPRV